MSINPLYLNWNCVCWLASSGNLVMKMFDTFDTIDLATSAGQLLEVNLYGGVKSENMIEQSESDFGVLDLIVYTHIYTYIDIYLDIYVCIGLGVYFISSTIKIL